MSDEKNGTNVDETPEPGEMPEKTPEAEQEEGGGGGGMLFPAIIILVLGAWCVKDGFITPGATDSPRFNQVAGILLGIGGLAMLVYEMLRPRSTPTSDETDEDDSAGSA